MNYSISKRAERLRKILAEELAVEEASITLASKIVEDLGADSLDYVEILMSVEEEFDFDVVDDAELENAKNECLLSTFEHLVNYLDEKLGPEIPGDDGLLDLTDEQFVNRYRPERAEDGSYYRQREWDGGEDQAAIQAAIAENRCWTAVDGDDGEFCIVWGNRTVNRLYNILTSRPIEDENWEVQVADDPEPVETEEHVRYRCVVPCRNAGGEPDFYFCEIICTEEQYEEGAHYDAAKSLAEAGGYESPGPVFDENDAGFQWIQVDWSKITSDDRVQL